MTKRNRIGNVDFIVDALDTWLRVSWTNSSMLTTIAELPVEVVQLWEFDEVPWIEIIPLEPDQRSYLRREAPVSPTFFISLQGRSL